MAELAEQLTLTISKFKLDGDKNQIQTSEAKETAKNNLITKLLRK